MLSSVVGAGGTGRSAGMLGGGGDDIGACCGVSVPLLTDGNSAALVDDAEVFL